MRYAVRHVFAQIRMQALPRLPFLGPERHKPSAALTVPSVLSSLPRRARGRQEDGVRRRLDADERGRDRTVRLLKKKIYCDDMKIYETARNINMT